MSKKQSDEKSKKKVQKDPSESKEKTQKEDTYFLDDTVVSEESELEKVAASVAEDSGSEKVQKELETAKNDFLYLKADFENYKKQAIKERSSLIKYASQSVVADLLNIADNFDRALEMELSPENLDSFKEGVQMISSELKGLFGKHGVQEIPCLGEKFDPTIHEALSSEQTDKYEPGYISQVFRTAYKMHDRIIRPAQVVVAEAPKSEEKSEKSEE